MKYRKKNANRNHKSSSDNSPLHCTADVSNHHDNSNNVVVIYDSKQHEKTLNYYSCSDILRKSFQQFFLTSVSLNVIMRLIYYYIIKYEAEQLYEDIHRVKKRFLTNSYSRIANELNIFILNSIEINSSQDSSQCFLLGSTKYLLDQSGSSPNIISELITDVFDLEKDDFNFDFFIQIYIHSIKQQISLGASLDTIKKFVIPNKDLSYDPQEKNYLRGAHSQLHDLRSVYNAKLAMSYTVNHVSSFKEENSHQALQKFTEKLNKLITSPDLMMCNHISSQNSINIKNFKQNFMNVNQIAVKDLYNNVLDTTDGLIATRIQNSITKSLYLVSLLAIGFIFILICRKIRSKLFK